MRQLTVTLTPLLNFQSSHVYGPARTEVREAEEITAVRREGFIDFDLSGVQLSYRVAEVLKYEIKDKA